MNNGWNITAKQDDSWMNNLNSHERLFCALMETSDLMVEKAIRIYREQVMSEFPDAHIAYIMDKKCQHREGVAVYSWRMEINHKGQIAKDPHAPQLLGEEFGYRDSLDYQAKQRNVLLAWISAFGRTKLAKQLEDAITSGESIEHFGRRTGFIN